jgi:hypothetical protein
MGDIGMSQPKMLLISESTVGDVLQYMQNLSIPKVSVGEVQSMMKELMQLEERQPVVLAAPVGLSIEEAGAAMGVLMRIETEEAVTMLRDQLTHMIKQPLRSSDAGD